MQTKLFGIEQVEVREHPYGGSAYDPRVKYYDFKKHPELIRQVLEDFKPYDHYKSVEYFYDLIEWINSPESPFETSDCRLEPLQANSNEKVDFSLMLRGRVMVLFRDLKLNITDNVSNWVFLKQNSIPTKLYPTNKCIEWLGSNSEQLIRKANPNFRRSLINIFYLPSFYSEVPFEYAKKFGYQVVYQFESYADNEETLFKDFIGITDTLYLTLTEMAEKVPMENPKLKS
ncbi:MAG TPA: hypothetical protein VF599_01710 [Pyrinomonadaceae bacterium]|jgi:hypothetical protein